MSMEFHRPAELPGAILDFWNTTIREQDPVSVLTRSPEWFQMMAETRDTARVAVLYGKEGGIKGLLPFFSLVWPVDLSLAGCSLKSREIRIVKVCGGDVVGKDLSSGEMEALLGGILDRCDADAIGFDRVTDEAGVDRLTAACDGSGRTFIHPVFRKIPHYRMVLQATNAEFRKIRTAESLRKIEGRKRALERMTGEKCRLVELRNRADLAPYSARIDALMNSSWQAELLRHSFKMDDYSQPAERGWLRSFLLMAGESATAFALCYQGMGTLTYEKIGYNRVFFKHSPGTILLYELLERLYERDTPKYVDFGEGEAQYKSLLANNVINVTGVMAVRKTTALVNLFRLVRFTKTLDSLARRFAGAIGIKSRLFKRGNRK